MAEEEKEKAVKHPAVFSDSILKKLDELVGDGVWLDPFCGTGRVFELERPGRAFVGIELEEEWAELARQKARTVGAQASVHQGDSLVLMADLIATDLLYAGMVTSPVYGNRMSDSHNASDPSRRRSYTHTLGRKLTEGNSGTMYFWQESYKAFHTRAWQLCYELTEPGGEMFLNVSDFIRDGARVRSSQWHMRTLRSIGYEIVGYYRVTTPRFRHGENDRARIDHEVIIHGRKP